MTLWTLSSDIHTPGGGTGTELARIGGTAGGVGLWSNVGICFLTVSWCCGCFGFDLSI
jgi:hypothetical protein